jgi:hypothetical protein
MSNISGIIDIKIVPNILFIKLKLLFKALFHCTNDSRLDGRHCTGIKRVYP